MQKIINSKWLVKRNSIDKPFRLYVFPYAGGNVTTFMRWQTLLHPEIELVGIQLPGRGSHYPANLFYEMEALIEAIIPLFQHNAKPFAFFGHSMGGLLAYQICQRLSIKPQALIISGCKGISLFKAPTKTVLSDNEVINRLRSYGGTPEGVLNDPDLMALFLPAIKADFTIVENFNWHPAPPERIPILLLAGDKDFAHHRDKALSWRNQTTQETIYREFPGGHFFINENVRMLLTEINSYLATIFKLPTEVASV